MALLPVPHLIVSKRGLSLVAAVGAVAMMGVGPQATGAAADQAAAREPKIVYLTFDDGPNPINSPRLLKLLAREHVPATFFVVGQYLAADPAHATRLWMGGHAVGNHTWSHPDLTTLSLPAIGRQLRATQRLMGKAGGRCMRPPYGAMNTGVSAAAAGLGLKPVMWTVDPQDWAHQNSVYIAQHVVTHVRDKAVVLLHDGGGPRAATIAAVRELIPQLRLRGYEFRTIPSCRVPLGGTVLDAAEPRKRRRPDPPPPAPAESPSPSGTSDREAQDEAGSTAAARGSGSAGAAPAGMDP